MKKIIFTIITLIIGITFVNASSCVITSGTGKNVGDEVSCGDEQFYIISNDGEEVKMLGKYNLMAGGSYYYLELDNYQVSNQDNIYQHPEVKKKLEEGYYIWNYDYTYDSTTKLYTFKGVSFMDDYLYDNMTVVFDSGYATEKEAYTDSKVKKYLEQGYKITGKIKVNSQYIAVKLNKYSLEDNKTVWLDETYRSLGDVLKTDSVKTLLEQGYRLYNSYYTNRTVSPEDITSKYYAVTLAKYQYYDEITIVFDEKYTNYTDYKNYINNDSDIQAKIKEGYSHEYYNVWGYYNSQLYQNYYGIHLYKYNEEKYFSNIYQNEKAVGIHGEAGKPEYPFYGIIANDAELVESYGTEYNDGARYGGDYYQDINLENHTYFKWYKKSLQDMGYPIKSVSTLSVSELNEIIKTLNGVEIPLQEWYENKTYIDEADTYLIGSIKDFLDNEHQWLWSTAYWLRTRPTDIGQSFFDITTLGDLCASDICKEEPTTGFRPVVTIAASDIVFGVKTKTDGNGTVEATHESAKSGENIKFTIEPKKGYELKEVKVTDEEGNIVTFTDYTFIMPSANVTIEATFTKVKNPNTTSISILAGLIFAIVSITIIKLNYSKLRWINE